MLYIFTFYIPITYLMHVVLDIEGKKLLANLNYIRFVVVDLKYFGNF